MEAQCSPSLWVFAPAATKAEVAAQKELTAATRNYFGAAALL